MKKRGERDRVRAKSLTLKVEAPSRYSGGGGGDGPQIHGSSGHCPRVVEDLAAHCQSLRKVNCRVWQCRNEWVSCPLAHLK
eukprot:1157367-Pelagomonas_calceolata.AAC.5